MKKKSRGTKEEWSTVTSMKSGKKSSEKKPHSPDVYGTPSASNIFVQYAAGAKPRSSKRLFAAWEEDNGDEEEEDDDDDSTQTKIQTPPCPSCSKTPGDK